MNRYFSAGLLTTALMTCSLNGGDCARLGEDKVKCCDVSPGLPDPFICGYYPNWEVCNPHRWEDEKFINYLETTPTGWDNVLWPVDVAHRRYARAYCDWESSFPPQCKHYNEVLTLVCLGYGEQQDEENCP